MTTFKTAVYERDGRWWFRWWNVGPDPKAAPFAQKLIGPCIDQQEAEIERQTFVEAERKKRPWVVFETEK
jgi:hypothetical protein